MKQQSLKILSSTILLTATLAAQSCDRDNRRPVVPISKESVLTPEVYAQTPHMHHGYNGNADAFKLVDQLDLENRQQDLMEKMSITAGEIQQWKEHPASLIYTGDLLSLKNCDDDALTKGAFHLAELWTQSYLLSLFSGPHVNWFTQALTSLQERDAKGKMRPRDIAHPDLITRLNKAADANFWAMTGVRFRIADLATISAETLEERALRMGSGSIQTVALPPDAVLGQIKISYEADLARGQSHEEIASASTIHSIAIHPTYINEFVVGVMRISQDPSKCGCDVLKMLNKWVRQVDQPTDRQARSGYFFLHTNILDKKSTVDEWRFTELKPVSNDSLTFSKRGEIEKQTKDSMLKLWIKSKIGSFDLSKGVEAAMAQIDFQKTAELVERITTNASREIYGPFDTPAGTSDIERSLRIVPMTFPVFVAPNPDSDRIELATNVPPLSLWYSGTLLDFGRNSKEGMRQINLLVDRDGKELPIQALARRHEETWTCAQCHARQVSNRLQAVPSDYGALLDVSEFMHFRHIGFGSGSGTKACNAMHGMPRTNFSAYISEYLLEVANGKELYGVNVDYERKTDLGIVEADTTPAGRIDYFRCQSRRSDFVDLN